MSSMSRLLRRVARDSGLDLATGFGRGQDEDRRWFRAHPASEWRLRPAYPGEALAVVRQHSATRLLGGLPPLEIHVDPEICTHILVLQHQPGARTRLPCKPPPNGPERHAWLEQAVAEFRKGTTAKSLRAALAMPPEARSQIIAWAVLPTKETEISRAIEAELRKQGEAVRESRGATVQ